MPSTVGIVASGHYESAAFTPTDISGLRLWLDSSDASTFTYSSGVLVSQWADKSGLGNHAAQSTGSLQPSRTGTINSLTVVAFGGHQLDLGNLMSGATAGTLYAVGQINADPAPSGFVAGPPFSTGSNTEGSLFPWPTNNNIYDNNGSTTRQVCGDPSPSLASPYLWGVISGSGDWRARLNESVLYSTGTNTVGWTTTATIGRDWTQPLMYHGKLAEIIFYDSVLSAGDIASLESYLAAKWGTP